MNLTSKLFIFFFFLSSSSFAATLPIWNIDNYFIAPSPGRFGLEATQTDGIITFVSYNYTDEETTIVYAASHLGPYYLNEEKDVFEILGGLLDGSNQAIKGKILTRTRLRLAQGNLGLDYEIEYTLKGYKVRKYGIFFYSRHQICHWSVQEIIGVSKLSAQKIFIENLLNVVPYSTVLTR